MVVAAIKAWNATDLIDFSEANLAVFFFWTLFNPLYWNIVAQLEYRHKGLTTLFGSARSGCYWLAASIFVLAMGRSISYVVVHEKRKAIHQ